MPKYRSILLLGLIAILVIVGSFPESNWAFSSGIDYSVRWLFNFLFQSDGDLGNSIIFPHGPLGVILYPLPGNIVFAYLVQSCIKVLFVWEVYVLHGKIKETSRLLLTFLFSLVFCLFLGISHLSILLIFLFLYNGIKQQNKLYLALATFLTAASFYVSAYQGAITLLLIISSGLYLTIFQRKVKLSLLLSFFLLTFILSIHWAIFGTFHHFLNYYLGLFNFIQDNSTAVAYYPNNNWYLLSGFMACLLIILILNWKNKNALRFLFICSLSFFAAWKHGIAREDTTHYRGFLELIAAFLLLFLIAQREKRWLNGFFVIAAILCLYLNLFNVENYGKSNYPLWRAGNFLEFSSSYDSLIATARAKSMENIKASRIPESIRAEIGENSIDIYPWEYTILATNKLNWKNRVVIQSYASYTSWLDQQNANHFNSTDAPEYLLWKLTGQDGFYENGAYSSIDQRYLLNDEPQTMKEILANYEFVRQVQSYYLYKKRENKLNFKVSNGEEKEANLGKWYPVQTRQGSLSRLRLYLDRSFNQRLKSLLYKDEMYWINLKLTDNRILRYRIVPKNAVNGLWINPLVQEGSHLANVQFFMIEASNPQILNRVFDYSWEHINCQNPDFIKEFFNANTDTTSRYMVNSFNDFESRNLEHWPSLGSDSLYLDEITENTWHIVKPNSFSSGLVYRQEDSLVANVEVYSHLKINWNQQIPERQVHLIIEIRQEGEIVQYKSLPVERQILNSNGPNTIINQAAAELSGPNIEIKVYLWNQSEMPLVLDDFRVVVKDLGF